MIGTYFITPQMAILLIKIKRLRLYRFYSQLVDEKLVEKRRVFWEQEVIREAAVREHLLSDREKTIRKCHMEAVKKGHFTYDDPETNKREYTRLRHYLRGACCGKLCRHCIYDHVKVPDGKIKSKRFNSAFWVYNETDADDINDEYMMSLRKPKLKLQRNVTSVLSVK